MYGVGFAKSRRGQSCPSPMVAQADFAFGDGAIRRSGSARSRMVGGDSLELPTSWV